MTEKVAVSKASIYFLSVTALAIIYQNIFVPISSIPGNILQVATVAVIVSAIIVSLRKAVSKTIPLQKLSGT